MDKKILIGGLIALMLTMVSGCNKYNTKTNECEGNNYSKICLEYANKYDMEKINGKSKITIKAPDFSEIGWQMAKDGIELTEQELENAIRKNSKEKEYVFIIDKDSDDEIKKNFLEQVSLDLIISAITETDINVKDWSVEK